MSIRSGRSIGPQRRRRPWVPDIESLERRDCPAAVSVSATPEVAETGGAATFTVTLSQRDTRTVTVGYVLGGTAKFASDYRLAIGTQRVAPSGTLTFAPGQTTRVISVAPVNDTAREGNESLIFTLLPPRNATLGTRTATMTMTDDDNYTASVVQRGSAEPGTNARFTLQLSAPATQRETFFLSTVDGTAVAGRDYQPLVRAPLVILPGQTSKDFWVPVLPSATRDGVFFVTAQSTKTDFPPVTPIGVLTGNGTPPAVPSLTVGDVSMSEDNSGTRQMVFSIVLTSPATAPVTVAYATKDGSATIADDDYEPAAGTLTFTPGEFRKTVPVTIVGDMFLEPDETFTIELSGATAAPVLRSVGTGTIVNDELDMPGFQITLTFIDAGFGPVPLDVQRIAREAAQRWSRVIVGDLPGATEITPDGTIFVDDLEMVVQMGLLDEPAGTDGQLGVLANASPTDYRTSAVPLPYRGETGLDPADSTGPFTIVARNALLDTITHEMGHALGFGAGFEPFDPFVMGDTFIGANAVRAYQQVFGTTATAVPLEPGVLSHWAEALFGSELMTPDAEAPGVRATISRVTIGALEDMGYSVNYAAAEPYVRPRTPGIAGAATTAAPAGRAVTARLAAPDTASVDRSGRQARITVTAGADLQFQSSRTAARSRAERPAGLATAGTAPSATAWAKLASLRG